MPITQILLLAVIQGLAEMLPISSSAHVILMQKLMGLDPSKPELTFLLVMLHTGTMLAALIYFGKRWIALLTAPPKHHFLKMVILATVCTGILGMGLKVIIEHVSHGDVENLFSNLTLIGCALLAAGILILWSSRHEKSAQATQLTSRQSIVIGLVQGLCLPFRGFSRSGATISASMMAGISRTLAEEFSFALAVALTPAAILLELKRLHHAVKDQAQFSLMSALTPGLIGMVFSLIAGLVALRWLSSWLERGRWNYFGYYCVVFSVLVFAAAWTGI